MKRAALIVAAVVVLLVGGSALYWWADGSAGTPDDFVDRVEDAGLDLDWSNAGPRGGDGVVQTDCGPVGVTVNDLDGELWLTTSTGRVRLTTIAIDELISCRGDEP